MRRWLSAIMVLVPFQMTAPCNNAYVANVPYDPCVLGSPLTDLAAIDVWGQRCGQTDSTFIGSVPARGRECDTLSVSLGIEAGHTWWIWTRSRDLSGNVSECRGPQLSIAVPLP